MFTPDHTFPQKEGSPPAFVCDSHLGRLARLLRLIGFDTLWRLDWTEPAIVRLVVNSRRVALSRSRSLLTRRELRGSLLITSDQPDAQAAQVVRAFDLASSVQLWGRCTRCNGLIKPVPKDTVARPHSPQDRALA